MKIEVTAEDIAKGKPHDPYLCPVGLAVARAFNVNLTKYADKLADTVPGFAVFGQRMRLGIHHFLIDPQVSQFIDDWENKEQVTPFSFEIPADDITRSMMFNVLS